MLAERGIEGIRVLQGLLSLAKRHRADDIERACDIALSHGSFRLRSVPRTDQAAAAAAK